MENECLAQAQKVHMPSLLSHIIASSVGGTITAIAVCPLDVVKAQLQAQVARLNSTDVPKYNGVLGSLATIAKNEGILSLWRGLTPTLVMTVPSTALYFTSYEDFKKKLASVGLTYGVVPISGIAARTLTVIVTSPFELIRTHTQANEKNPNQSGMIKEFQKIINQHGFRGLWTGFRATLLRDVPFSAIYWTCFEHFKLKMRKRSSSKFTIDFVSGVAAGSIAAFVTTPIDVVKTQTQMRLHQLTPKVLPIAEFRKIVAEEGFSGLWKGVVPRTLRVAPSCAIMISTYGVMVRYLQHAPS